MVFLTPKENFSAAISGMVNFAGLESIYASFMDTAFVGLGRPCILHLQPIIKQDTSTIAVPQSQQYNPFFGGTPAIPNPIGKNAGVKVTPRDIQYLVRPRIGPQPADKEMGVGELKANEAVLTFPIIALDDLKNVINLSLEGRRYQINTTRPFGFTVRREILVFCSEINEIDSNTQNPNG